MTRILFITSNRLGDAVLSTGLLAKLLADHPGARVTVVAGPVPAGLFQAVPGLDEVIVLNKRRYSLHWFEMWRRTVLTFWDVVVDLRNAPLSYLLLAKRQIHLGQAAKQDIHRVRAMGSLLGMTDNPPAPTLWTLPEHDAKAETLIPSGGPVLAIGPTSNWIGKTWSAERFIELATRLTAPDGILPDARVVVIAHSSERDIAQPVLDALKGERLIDLVGDFDLPVIAACLKRAAFYVGNDSGLMHLAAASGVPTLGLFGPSRESHYAPWGPKCRAVRGEKSYQEVFPPDYDWRAKRCYMEDLQVDQAEAAARQLWNDVS